MLAAAIALPLTALAPAGRRDVEKKQETKQQREGPAGKQDKRPPAAEDAETGRASKDRIDRVRSRMNERDKEMDRRMNKKK